MSGRVELDQWRKLYDDVGGLLFVNALAPTTAHYDLCRRYITSSDPEIRSSVEAAIARHGALTAAAAADVIAVHSRDVSVDELISIARDTRSRMDDAATTLGDAAGHVASYADALHSGANNLATASSPLSVVAELIQVTRAMNERASAAHAELRRAGEEIETLRSQLAEAARTANSDPLTGLPNRRALDMRLQSAFAEAKQAKTPFSLAICDIDHFKNVNDTHGHPVGDQVIKYIADALSKLGRENLFVARYGGEEFVIVFEGLDPKEAAVQLDGVRRDVAAKRMQVKATGQSLGQISFSGGVSGIRGRRDPSAMLKAADEALYQAKNDGRNRVCIAE